MSKMEQVARDFLERYPIGTQLSQDEFDEWTADRLALSIPERGLARAGHVQRRGNLRNAINAAASLPTMNEGSVPYRIIVEPAQMLRVMAMPRAAIVHRERITRKVHTLAQTWQKTAREIFRPINRMALTTFENAMLEAELQLADELEDDLRHEADKYTNRCRRLLGRIQARIAGPTVKQLPAHKTKKAA